MTEPRLCRAPTCRKPLVIRPGEQPRYFRKRLTCGPECVALLQRRWTEEQKARLFKLIDTGVSLKEAAREIGVPHSRARDIVERAGISMRTLGKAKAVQDLLAAMPVLNDHEVARRCGCKPEYVAKVRQGECGQRPHQGNGEPANRRQETQETRPLVELPPSPRSIRAYELADTAERALFAPWIREAALRMGVGR